MLYIFRSCFSDLETLMQTLWDHESLKWNLLTFSLHAFFMSYSERYVNLSLMFLFFSFYICFLLSFNFGTKYRF